MPPSFLHFIIVNGYIAIFVIVFMQEIGIPTIVPNEISLFFFGYLASQGNIHLPWVLLTAIAAEISGTTLVYLIFYIFGPRLSRIKFKKLPIPHRTVEMLKARIDKTGKWGIFIGRMTPFLRGYTSVLAGLLQVNPRNFLLIISASALCSTGAFVMAGWYFGPYWRFLAQRFPDIGKGILFCICVLVIVRLLRFLSKKMSGKKSILPPAVIPD